jgi:hypothetical protein
MGNRTGISSARAPWITSGVWSGVCFVKGIMRDELDSLTNLDAVMPTQLVSGRRALDVPERKLRLAVLEDAIHALQRHARARSSRGRRLYEDALGWIMDDDRREPFSFANVCEALGLDPSYVRRGLFDRSLAPIRGQGFSLRRAA